MLLELLGDLCLAARHDRDMVRVVRDGTEQGVVGGGVAGVQRDHQVDPIRPRGCVEGCGGEAHPVEAQLPRPFLRARGQLGPRLDGEQRALAGGLEKQLVEDEAEVGIAAAGVDQDRVTEAGEDVVQRRPEQPDQVVDLLQLAERVGVEVPVAGEQVQLLEERWTLLRQQLLPDAVRFDLSSQAASSIGARPPRFNPLGDDPGRRDCRQTEASADLGLVGSVRDA